MGKDKLAEWATFDEEHGYYEREKDLHVHGTISRGGKLEFWLSRPRPVGLSIDEWEELEESKWNRIFGKKEAQ